MTYYYGLKKKEYKAKIKKANEAKVKFGQLSSLFTVAFLVLALLFVRYGLEFHENTGLTSFVYSQENSSTYTTEPKVTFSCHTLEVANWCINDKPYYYNITPVGWLLLVLLFIVTTEACYFSNAQEHAKRLAVASKFERTGSLVMSKLFSVIAGAVVSGVGVQLAASWFNALYLDNTLYKWFSIPTLLIIAGVILTIVLLGVYWYINVSYVSKKLEGK